MSDTTFQPRAKKTWQHSLATVALVALAVSLFGAVGVVRAVNANLNTVKREEIATTALSPADAEFENYLFVGSDSRVGADPSDADYGNVGDAGDIGGQRSDTLMVLHYVKRTGTVSLMSIPRDLWVAIGNGENEQRINTAYQEGTDVLVRTVQRALNIPIHHYVEIDFQGFKRIVEAVGGVNVCVEYPSRDKILPDSTLGWGRSASGRMPLTRRTSASAAAGFCQSFRRSPARRWSHSRVRSNSERAPGKSDTLPSGVHWSCASVMTGKGDSVTGSLLPKNQRRIQRAAPTRISVGKPWVVSGSMRSTRSAKPRRV